MTREQKKVIIVDDDVQNLTAIKNTLKDLYEAYPCPSASKMFDLLEHILPDLVLLDVEMPVMNGYDAARILKSSDTYQNIPIIFLTSRADAKSEVEGLSIGAVDYIHKPFVAPLLLQRIQTHLSLIDHQIEAQNASHAKGEFLSNMSHEIRSPLSAVIGMINIAANTNDITKIKYCLKRAQGASKQVLDVINDILDISKIEANKFELAYGEFNFEKTVADIADVMSFRAEEKHLEFAVDMNKNVPPFIISDELRLSQVITNLLTNAIKFTPEKGKVVLNVEKTDDAGEEITLKISVEDSGIGVSQDQQKRLFTFYTQADSSITKKFGGTGLGLAISKRIVELMQGTIWIESELNKGARFIFTVKVKKGTGTAKNPEKDPSIQDESGETDFNFTGYTILAAEDIEINREILAALLEETGINIDFAEDGKTAVSMFTENPGKYNLILMDIQMPKMDGYEATQAIRALELKQAKDIPIIAMTASVFREDIEKCLSAGMNSHTGKPIAIDDLFVKLKRFLV